MKRDVVDEVGDTLADSPELNSGHPRNSGLQVVRRKQVARVVVILFILAWIGFLAGVIRVESNRNKPVSTQGAQTVPLTEDGLSIIVEPPPFPPGYATPFPGGNPTPPVYTEIGVPKPELASTPTATRVLIVEPPSGTPAP